MARSRARGRPVERSRRRSCGVESACGGCPLLSTPPREQLRIKEDTLAEALAEHALLEDRLLEPCVPAPEGYDYRVRAKLAVRRERDGVRLGLFRRGSDRVVDLATCLVHRPVVQAALAPLAAWLAAKGLAYPQGPVIVADLRESRGRRLHLTLVVDGASPRPPRWPLDALRDALPHLEGVALNEGDVRSSYALGPRSVSVDGAPRVEVELASPAGPLAFEVPPGAFFQVNPAALPALHARMAEHLGGPAGLVDLYCGVGTHGIALAARTGADGLLGIEEHPEAVAAASRNASRAGVAGRFVAGRVESELARAPLPREGVGLVLNPGRPGCRDAVLDAILEARPARVAYLSCAPRTLARDLARLAGGGLHLERVVPFDFMPQTDQVEALALLA